MVLSNKKLKQKLRAELLAKSVDGPDSKSNSGADSQPQSLKSLIDSVTLKPRLSKREKRRKTHSLEGSEGLMQKSDEIEEVKEGDFEATDGSISGDKSEKKKKKKKKKGKNKGNKVEDFSKGDEEREDAELEVDDDEKNEKKKRKRKREEGMEDGAVKEVKLLKKKKKKKKKGKNKEEEKAIEEQGFMEMDAGTESQVNEDVATKVYVGGIPYQYTEEDIQHYFEGCGTITEVDCMKFPDSGKFRGIAMISFETEASAKRALALDRAEMGGLQLTIQPYKRTRSNKVCNFAPKMVEGYNRIYVGNLSWDITEDDLRKLFWDCSISSVRFGMDKETGEFRGYAHVDFADSVSVAMALKLDQEIVCGRPVKISCAVPKKGVQTHSRPQPSTNEVNNDGGSATSGKMRRRTCYECGEKGHISSACPRKQAADATKSDAA